MPDELINGIDVAEFLPLAHSIALAFARSGTPDADELCSIAQSALMRAAEGYRPSKGAFSPYAGTVVRNAMLTEIRRRKGTGVQVPVDVLDFDPAAVASEAAGIFPNGPDNAAADSDRRSLLREIQSALSSRDQKAIRLLSEGASLAEIGRSLGVSKTMAHKIVTAAVGKMREALGKKKIFQELMFSQSSYSSGSSIHFEIPRRHFSFSDLIPKWPTSDKLKFNFDEWAQSLRAGTARRPWWRQLFE